MNTTSNLLHQVGQLVHEGVHRRPARLRRRVSAPPSGKHRVREGSWDIRSYEIEYKNFQQDKTEEAEAVWI